MFFCEKQLEPQIWVKEDAKADWQNEKWLLRVQISAKTREITGVGGENKRYI